MSLTKRRLGRRTVGVAVAASLMVLGLQLPAQAVLGLSAFAPASGPLDCVVVITGTDFTAPDVDIVQIGGEDAPFEIQSDTEIWATVPADPVTATLGASGFITVENTVTGESVSSTSAFTGTAGNGDCASTIASFSPTCGLVGTTVAITGTNLIQPTATGADTYEGADVEFSPFVAANGVDATHTGASESPTSLSVLVPTGAGDGPISVNTLVDEVFSTAEFNVVTDVADCVSEPTTHARSISFRLSQRGRARGVVSSTEDPAVAECVASVPVKIQRRKAGGGWKTKATTTTNDSGAYKARVKPRRGKYRALAPRVTLEDASVCLRAKSARVRLR